MNRRTFGKGILFGAAGGSMKMGQRGASTTAVGEGYITDVAGIKVGHFTDTRRPTGCTVILCEGGAVGGVDVRGSAPGTRETDLLDPMNLVDKAHAVVLSGGSAFGLDTATGVMKYLEEHNIGFDTRVAKVPIVPAAILYDLNIGDARIRPNADAGYKACQAAKSGAIDEGTIGAGAGATIGKAGGGKPMKGGIGTSSIRLPNGITVGAIVAVNCVGNVFDPKTGRIVAGARSNDGKTFVDIISTYRAGRGVTPNAGQATTIGVVATNASGFTKAHMKKIAEMSHDGMARAINPAHTMGDGDTLFALSTGTSNLHGDVTAIGALAAEAVSEAILRAVIRATSVPGFPSYNDITK
jgi:L-aminopeptidase/D-esterase-like protein